MHVAHEFQYMSLDSCYSFTYFITNGQSFPVQWVVSNSSYFFSLVIEIRNIISFISKKYLLITNLPLS